MSRTLALVTPSSSALIKVKTAQPTVSWKRLAPCRTTKRLRWYAELADKVVGEVASSPPGRLALVTHEAVGVVAAIVPWNFPLLMAITKVAPALAAGNVVILKPAESSSLTALALAEVAAGVLPPDTLQVVTGLGSECGQALAESRRVDALAFTGSTATGARILATVAASNLKRVSLECGGKSPHVVLDPAITDTRMVDEIVWGICYNQGQVCDAGANLILVGDAARYEGLLSAIPARMSALTMGDPFNEAIDLGSMISHAHLAKMAGSWSGRNVPAHGWSWVAGRGRPRVVRSASRRC